MKNLFSRLILLILALFLFSTILTACNGGDDEPAPAEDDEDEDRDEDEEQDEDEDEEPDVTADFDESSSDVSGIAVGHPDDWAVEVAEDGSIQIASDEQIIGADSSEIEDGAFILLTSMDMEFIGFLSEEEVDPDDAVALLDVFTSLITEEDEETTFTVTEEASTATFNGLDGAMAEFEFSGEERDGVAIFVAIPHSNRVVYAFAAITESVLDDTRPIVDAIFDSIDLSEPAVVEEAVEVVPTAEPAPTAEPTAEPAPVVAEPISQWPSDAVASTQYTDDSWSALQAVGEPDTPECGDIGTAWASASSNTVDWLEVYYDVPVTATEINIYQTYNPDQVVAVDLIDMDFNIVPIYEQAQTAVDDPCPYVLSLEVDAPDVMAQGVRITIDQSVLGLGWNEIDAVELVGVPPSDAGVDIPVGTAPVVGEGPLLFENLPQPDLESGLVSYTNGNFVNDIAVLDNVVYGASDGGMVAWDYTSGEFLGKWTTLDGILHNVAGAITVCSLPETRVVLGTDGGLSLYDPATGAWENWTPENSGMGSSSGIDTLTCVPESGALVIGYDLDGVDVYESASGTWTYYGPFDELESGFATAIAVKGDLEEIWIAHIAAVSVIRADGSISYYDDENSNLDDPNTDAFEHFVEGIAVDDTGTVWFAQGGGLTRVDGDNQFTFFNSDDIPGWPFWTGADALTVGPDGTLWTNSTFGGVCQFDQATATCLNTFEDEDGMAEDFNNTIIVDESGRIFYGSDGEGISVYDGAWTNYQLDELAASNSYRAIAQGADGSIWVGGFFGAQRFFAYDADAAWESLEDELGFATINTFYPRADGMWVGHTSGASFYEYATGTWTHLERGEEAGQGIYDGEVLAITQDSNGRMWFGTSGGVTIWDGSTFLYDDLLNDEERADENSARWVYSLLTEGDNVWVGGISALFRFDANLDGFRWDDTSGLPGFFPSVYALALDLEGNVLIAVDSTLLQFDGSDSFIEIYEAERSIRTIVVDEEGDIALGTEGAGAFLRVSGEWLSLTTAEGLPSNFLSGGQSILVDYLGTLWIAAGEGGIVRIVP